MNKFWAYVGDKMKKLLLATLALCMCVSLAACNAADSNNLFGDFTDQGGLMSSVVMEKGTYQHGNMQKMPAGEFSRLGNDVLFTFVSNGRSRLYSYDLTTGKVRLYCDDATCTHSDCLAESVTHGLEVYQGELYGMNGAHQAVVVDGTELKALTKGEITYFRHHDNKAYIKTADWSLVVLEEGSDEPRIILEEYTGIWGTIFDNYIYATTSDSIIRVDLTGDNPTEEVLVPNAGGTTDGQYIYYVDRKSNYLYRCDLDGSNAKLLVEKEVLLASINFDNEYFYYRLNTRPTGSGADSYDIYRFPKSDPAKIEKIAALPVPAYQVYTVPGADILFVNTFERSNGEQGDIYVTGTDGSHVIKLEIPEY